MARASSRSTTRVPDFIASLAAAGYFDLSVYDDSPRDEPADTARRLGIEHIARLGEDEPSAATFLFGQSGGMVPTEPNLVTEWVEEVLAHRDYADTTAKLLRHEADERHVFLMSGGRTDFGVHELLRHLGQALPTRRPRVPLGITHVWVVPEFGERTAPCGMCAIKEGWTAQPLPAEED